MQISKTYSNRSNAGEYTPTSIDTLKACNNRLTSVCGKYYTVITTSGEMLEFVGKRAFNKWAKNNEYVTDF
jgi:hypothetical protein